MIKPWEIYPNIWKTEAAFLSYIRGGIRRHLWAKSPVKLEFIKKARSRIVNPVVSNRKRFPEVWGGVCEICKKEFALKDMEVDHKTGEHSLKKVEDIQAFVQGIVFVTEEDLALLCKPCHKIKTHAERKGMSQSDAAIEKMAIATCKLPVNELKTWIRNNGRTPGSNAKERRAQVIDILKGVKQ